jgi:hypothetical protein
LLCNAVAHVSESPKPTRFKENQQLHIDWFPSNYAHTINKIHVLYPGMPGIPLETARTGSERSLLVKMSFDTAPHREQEEI